MQPKTSGVTLRHVAARAGVSQSTVSNAINRPAAVAPATLARITSAIQDLGFIRNDAARALRLGESNAVGLIVSEASSPYYAELVQEAGATLWRSGFSSLLGNSLQRSAVERDLIALFEAQRVRGLIIAPTAELPSPLQAFTARGVAVVFADLQSPSDEFCSVSVDHELGGRLAIEHLRRSGRRRIALLRGSVKLPQIAARVRGAKATAARLGVTLEEIAVSDYFVEGGLEAGSILASRPTARRPDAVFAVNDLLAMGVLSRLLDRGITVPEEIAVVGYDDSAVSAVARMPLTTVRQPPREVGRRAAMLLIDEMETSADEDRQRTHVHEHLVFQPELVVRATTLP